MRRTGAGGMVLDAALTRSGIFVYRGATPGTVIREFRPAEEVFKADSLATLRDLPVTDRHPPPGKVTPENVRQYRRGHVSGDARQDSDKVAAALVIDDAELMDAVERRDRTEISCGYNCDTENTPGTFEGQPYDRIQRNIRYNHVAVVERGRAGSQVRLRLDAAGDMVIEEETKGTEPMKSIRIDGIDYPLNTPAEIDAAIAAHNRFTTKNDAAIAALTSERETAKGRADAAEEKAKTLEGKLSEANDPKRLDAAVSQRAAVLSTARTVLGAEEKIDGLTEDAIMRKVIAKKSPAAVLEGKSADYIRSRFDAIAESLSSERADEDPDGLADLRRGTSGRTDADDDADDDTDRKRSKLSPRERMRADNAERATKPLAISRDN